MARKIKRRPPTEIDRAFLRKFRVRMQEALDEIGEELGLNLTAKGMTFEKSSFTGRYEAHIKGKMSQEERHYFERQPHLGLPTLNSVIVLKGKPYKIIGYKKRATKRPILLERNAKQYNATIEQVVKGAKNDR